MNIKKIAVLFGGCSSEYNVSLISAAAVIDALDCNKYDISTIGITRDGIWYQYSGSTEHLRDDTWHQRPDELRRAVLSPSRGEGLLLFDEGLLVSQHIDAAFPVLHGKCGEDGTVQGLCELAGIPVAGCGAAASALCMDKDRAHKLVSLQGIRVPRSVCFQAPPDTLALNAAISKLPPPPLFVKPVKTGSSFGITKILDLADLPEAVRTAFLFDDAVIVEEGIPGFETGCAVVGNAQLITGSVDEIELSGGFFDFMEKYSLKTSKIHMPARVDHDTEQRLRDTAALIFRTLGCRGFARVDMFLTPQREIVFNEVNTIPGFTAHSRFPSMMRGAGFEFPALLDLLINLALNCTAEGCT